MQRPNFGAMVNMDIDDIGLDSCYLIFEDDGCGDSFSALDLKRVIQDRSSSLPKLDLVILMACHSERIGNIFLKSANHVICVNQSKAVLDEASIEFTINLYKLLLNGETVTESFKKAIGRTKIVLGRQKEHEAEDGKIFKLLSNKGQEDSVIFHRRRCKKG